MTPSERIKALVDKSCLSYADLEEKTGISRSALQRYATGKTKKIPVTAIENLAKVFNVTAAYLMGWDEQGIRIGIDAETGDVIPQLDNEDIISILGDVMGLPEQALDEVKYFVDLLKYKYTERNPEND